MFSPDSSTDSGPAHPALPSATDEEPWVLIVEDDAVFRLLLTKVAGKCQCRVHSVSTGMKAIEHLTRQAYQLVLLDCHLPDGHGEDVAAFACSPASKAPTSIVAISSDDSAANVERILVAGAGEFFLKRVSTVEIAALIERYCGPAQRG